MSRRRKHPTPWIEPLGPLSEVPSPERDERDEPALPPASRREFLRGLGIGAAVTLTACQRSPVRHALPYLVPPDEITPGVPVHYASTCTACPAACGLMVSALDGRPVKLEGHPDHPLSKGASARSGRPTCAPCTTRDACRDRPSGAGRSPSPSWTPTFSRGSGRCARRGRRSSSSHPRCRDRRPGRPSRGSSPRMAGPSSSTTRARPPPRRCSRPTGS
ncbi:MAG: hypothetical protein IPF66_21825 [Holophagales bacterium]|nr:hypothetical protein [Holophagales bacterium]